MAFEEAKRYDRSAREQMRIERSRAV